MTNCTLKINNTDLSTFLGKSEFDSIEELNNLLFEKINDKNIMPYYDSTSNKVVFHVITSTEEGLRQIQINNSTIDLDPNILPDIAMYLLSAEMDGNKVEKIIQDQTNNNYNSILKFIVKFLEAIGNLPGIANSIKDYLEEVEVIVNPEELTDEETFYLYPYPFSFVDTDERFITYRENEQEVQLTKQEFGKAFYQENLMLDGKHFSDVYIQIEIDSNENAQSNASLSTDKFAAVMVPYASVNGKLHKLYIKENQTIDGYLELTINVSKALKFGANKAPGLSFAVPNLEKANRKNSVSPKVIKKVSSISAKIKSNPSLKLGPYLAKPFSNHRVFQSSDSKFTIAEFEARLKNTNSTLGIEIEKTLLTRAGGVKYVLEGVQIPVFELPLQSQYVEDFLDVIDYARTIQDSEELDRVVEYLKLFYNYTGSDIKISRIDDTLVVSSSIKIEDGKIKPQGKYVPITDRNELRQIIQKAKLKIRREQTQNEPIQLLKIESGALVEGKKIEGLDWVKQHLYTNAIPFKKAGEDTLTYEPDYSFIIDVMPKAAVALPPVSETKVLEMEGGLLTDFIGKEWRALFSKEGVSPDTIRLAELIFSLATETKKLDGWTVTFVDDLNGGGIADLETKEINIDKNGNIPLLLVEEVSHALTSEWLMANQGSAEYKRLEKIAEKIGYSYAGDSARTPIELLAKLGDPEIASKLMSQSKSKSKATLFDDILDVLKNIFERLFKGFNKGLYKEMATLYLNIATRESITLAPSEEVEIIKGVEIPEIKPPTNVPNIKSLSSRKYSSEYEVLIQNFIKSVEEDPEYGKQFLESIIQTLTGDLVSYISIAEKTPQNENEEPVYYSNIPNLLNGTLNFEDTYDELLYLYYLELKDLQENNKLETLRAKYLLFILNRKQSQYVKEVFKQKNKVFEIKADKTIVNLEQEEELILEQGQDTSTVDDLDKGQQQEDKALSQQVLEGSETKEHFKKEPNKFNFEQADKKVKAFVKLIPQIERDELTGMAKVYTEAQVDELIEQGVPGSRFFPFRIDGQVKYVRAAETEMGAIKLNDTIVTWSNLSKLFAGKFSIEDMLAYGNNNISRVLREIPEFLVIEPYLNSKQVLNLEQNQLVIKFESAFKRFENPLYIVLNNNGVRTVINESADIFPIVINQVNNTLRGYVVSNKDYKDFYDPEKDTLDVKGLLKSYGIELGDLRTYPQTPEKKRALLGKLGFIFTKDIFTNDTLAFDDFFNLFMKMLTKVDATAMPIEIADFVIKDQKVTTPSGTITVKGLNNVFKNVYKKQNEFTPFSYSIMSPNAEGELQSAYSIPNSILQDAALLTSTNYSGSATNTEVISQVIPRSTNPTFKASLFFGKLFNKDGQRTKTNLEVVNWNGEKITEEGSASRGRLNVDLDEYSKLLFDFVGLLTQGLHENTRAQVSSTSYAIRLDNYENGYKYPITPAEARAIRQSSTAIPQDTVVFTQFVKYFNAAVEEAKMIAEEKGTSVQVPVMFSKDFENLLPEEGRVAFLTTPIDPNNQEQNNKFAELLQKFFRNAMKNYASDMAKAGIENIKSEEGAYPPAIQKLIAEGYKDADLYALYVLNSYIIRTEEIILFQGSHERIGTKKAKYFKRANTVQSTRIPITGSAAARAFLNEKLKEASFATQLNLDPFALGDTFRTAVIKDVVEPSTAENLIAMEKDYYASATLFYKNLGKEVDEKAMLDNAETVRRSYESVTISDGQGIISPDAYIAFRMGIGGDTNLLKAHAALALDMVYNQDIYFTEEEIAKFNIKKKEELTEQEIQTMREGMALLDSGKVIFPTLKWTHRGSTSNQSGVANEVLDKFSIFPPYIQYVYNKPQLKALFLSMLASNTAYVKFESGTKLDVVTGAIPITSTSTFEKLNQQMSALGYELLSNNLGEQITTPTYAKITTVFGSQFRKLIVQALDALGQKDLSLAWDNSVIEMSASLREKVLKEFGVKNEDFSKIDLAKIAKVLKDHAVTKDLTDNVTEFLRKMEEGNYPYMEANLSQKDVQNLIASVVKKVAVQKIHGSQLIQVSSALDHFDDRLGWYAMGRPAECKVSMMGDFMNLLNLPEVQNAMLNLPIEDRTVLAKTRVLNELLKSPEFRNNHKDALTIVTYRIPTQGLNSMDIFTIKEFLPNFQAPQIVLPPEAVVKSGTDYDYDKAPAIFPRIDTLGRFISKEVGAQMLDLNKLTDAEKLNQNKVLQSAKDILMLPESYFILITPNSTDFIFDPLQEFFDEFYPPDFREEPSGSQIASHKANYQKFKVVRMSDLLGIAATTNTLSTILQNYKENINRTYIVPIGKTPITVSIPNKLSDTPPTSKQLSAADPFTEDGILKSEILSQAVNVTVDAPGDDRFGYTGFNLNNFGAALYLMFAHNVPFTKVLYFFHHPAVLKYEEYLKKASMSGTRPSRAEVERHLKEVFFGDPNMEEPLILLLPQLAKDLTYDTIRDRFLPAAQVERFDYDSEMIKEDKAVLAYYLMVLDASEQVRRVNSVINFDRAPDNVMMKHIKRMLDVRSVVDSGIVSTKFLSTIFRNSMISGVYTNRILSGMTNKLFPALYDPENVIMFMGLSEGIYGETKDKFITKVTNDFMLSIIQNFATVIINDKEFNLYDLGVKNLTGDAKYKLAAKAIEYHKRFEKEGMDIRLLRILTNSPGKRREIVNVRVFRGFEDATEDRNRLISEFRFLLNHSDEKVRNFAINLLATGITQSGYSKSPLFFSDIIPEEFISPIITNAVRKYIDTANKQKYAEQFQNKFIFNEGALLRKRKYQVESYRFKDYKVVGINTSKAKIVREGNTDQLLNNMFEKSLGVKPAEPAPALPAVGEVVESAQPDAKSTTENKLFNQNDKELKKGSVVEYKGVRYLFWNLTSVGTAQLIKTDGTKFSGNPGLDKLTVLGSYPTTMYNNTEYIVTDNNNVYSGATGNLVYTGTDNSSKVQKQRIIDAAKAAKSAQPVQPTKPVQVAQPVSETKPQQNFVFSFEDGTTVNVPFQLNAEQENVLKELETFINGRDSAITLSGAAGTGKTTVISIFNKWLRKNYIIPKYSSPTHRANSVTKLMNPNIQVYTLHSLFGLNPDIDFEKGDFDVKKLKFAQRNKLKIEKGDVLIIDESSLINDALFDFLQESIQTQGIRIIYVGDESQLRPVGQETKSKVFTANNLKVLSLKKVERTGDNAVLEESVNIRNGKDWSYTTKLNENNEGVVYVNDSQEFLRTSTRLFVEQAESTNKLYFRILSATNQGVDRINKNIRETLYQEDAVNQLVPGELLMGYDNFDYDYDSSQYRLYNGGDYQVVSVRKDKKTIYEIGEEFSGYYVTVQNLLNPQDPTYTLFVVDLNEPDSKAIKFAEKIQSIQREAAAAKGRTSAMLFEQATRLKAQIAFMKDIKKTDPLDNKQKTILAKTFSYGYAHTIHKSQGGSYDNVMIMADTIDVFRDPENRQELKYVAVSRARKTAYIFTNKPITKQDKNAQDICVPF